MDDRSLFGESITMKEVPPLQQKSRAVLTTAVSTIHIVTPASRSWFLMRAECMNWLVCPTCVLAGLMLIYGRTLSHILWALRMTWILIFDCSTEGEL